jgi:hypothetical protein
VSGLYQARPVTEYARLAGREMESVLLGAKRAALCLFDQMKTG